MKICKFVIFFLISRRRDVFLLFSLVASTNPNGDDDELWCLRPLHHGFLGLAPLVDILEHAVHVAHPVGDLADLELAVATYGQLDYSVQQTAEL